MVINKKDELHSKALKLSYFTLLYNIIECILSIMAGFFAGSTALLGFGSDSLVESISATIMIWRFRKHGFISNKEEDELEKKAIYFVGISFFIFGIYILFESLRKLIILEKPEPSIFGIIIAIASIIVMPILFYRKFKTGKSIGSKSLIADSKQTLACLFMSVSLLIGLGLNYLFGLWWADLIVGLFIVLFLFKEGYEIIFEDDYDIDNHH
ncbi:MAG: cobalt transporter [Candidatus Asgardarchaeum californiense]|nr:MAG: cobalt transporter [Candidatus Asgardarchaeum californiense]